jgi:predicted ArsR family transcriptional regulator
MQETRQTILNILKQRSQVTIEELAQDLHLTPATIRHHLDILRGDGFVEVKAIRHRLKPGRPQHLYTLTERANEHFPKNYAEFADLTLKEIGERAGFGELDAIMRGVAQRMIADVPRPAPGEPMPQRLDRVVSFLNERGYLARWELADRGYLLHTANCPYQALAHRRTAPCVMDMTQMTELLGVTPERIQSIASGALACAYRVPEVDDRSRP